MLSVYRIDWEESERGWGTRDDGYSLHATKNDAEKYVEDYWEGMPNCVPDEYSRPGKPYLFEVDKKMHDEIQDKRNIRNYK